MHEKTTIPPARLDETLGRAIEHFFRIQATEGYWVFDLEADVTIPAEYIMFKRFMGLEMDPGLKGRLAAHIRRKQLPDGGWPLFDVDGHANLSASIKAYFGLKLCGDSLNAPHMVKARQLILSLGGAAKANVFTRYGLCLFGQMPWRVCPAMPIESVLLPRWFFFHFSKVSYWSRVVVIPLLIIYSQKPVCRLRPEEGVQELFIAPPSTLYHLDGFRPGSLRKNAFILLDRILKVVMPYFPKGLHERAIREAERWTRERMCGAGGIGGVLPAMVNAVEALHLLGCGGDDPDFVRGSKAADDLIVDRGGEEAFCQPCNSPIWDTCLALSAMLEAGVEPGHKAMASAVDWLFSEQVFVRGDWADKTPELAPGGWAFQFENAIYPDLDDTAMVLMALFRAGILERPEYRERIAKAANWVIGMQGSDGGWGAFDIDNNALYLNDIPFADHGALLDPSTSDLTGRCIEMLSMLGYGKNFPPIARGLAFLRREQEKFGGWYGRWGCNYIYGTWSVLVALRQVGEDMGKPYVRKAAAWLKSIQNRDGGFGETLYSYDDPSLAGTGGSTCSQTAWALLGLMAAGEVDSPEVERGIAYLLKGQDESGAWDEKHYTGTGFPRVFYLRYHGYCQYFPLWALGIYRRLKSGQKMRQTEVSLSRPLDLPLPALK